MQWSRYRVARWVFASILAAAGALALPQQAAAQFTCEQVGGGANFSATQFDSLACGTNASATGEGSSAVGVDSSASGESSTAVGYSSSGTDLGSAFGTFSAATGGGSAFGYSSSATGAYAVSVGAHSGAPGNDSAAVGVNTQPNGMSSLAIGGNVSVFSGVPASQANVYAAYVDSAADYGVAVGAGAYVGSLGVNAIAFGPNAVANNVSAIAIGESSNATGNASMALGANAQASAFNSTAIGSNSVANSVNTVSVGSAGQERKIVNVANGTISSSSTEALNGREFFTANQRVAAAFGGGAGLDSSGQLTAPSYLVQGITYDNVGGALGALDAQVASNTSIISTLQNQGNNGAVGLVQQNTTTRALSIGAATDGTSVSVAGTAGARSVTGVAAGDLSASSTDAVNGSQLFTTNQQVAANTTAIANLSSVVAGSGGGGSNYVKVNSTGPVASATGVNATAIGSGASSSGDNAVAMGTNAQATQSGSIAVGMNAASTGINAIAIGTGATATGSVAVGTAASAGNGGAAFGDGAIATASHSTAIGPNASATAANSVAIGSGSTNTQDNTVSFGSAGNERRLTNVAAGINPTDAVNVGQLQSVASGFQSQIGGLQTEVTNNQQEARRGIVAAVAVAPVLMPSAIGKTTVAVNTGFYRGEAGVGIGISHRLNLSYPTVIYGSYSNGGGSEHVGRAGMAVEF